MSELAYLSFGDIEFTKRVRILVRFVEVKCMACGFLDCCKMYKFCLHSSRSLVNFDIASEAFRLRIR